MRLTWLSESERSQYSLKWTVASISCDRIPKNVQLQYIDKADRMWWVAHSSLIIGWLCVFYGEQSVWSPGSWLGRWCPESRYSSLVDSKLTVRDSNRVRSSPHYCIRCAKGSLCVGSLWQWSHRIANGDTNASKSSTDSQSEPGLIWLSHSSRLRTGALLLLDCRWSCVRLWWRRVRLTWCGLWYSERIQANESQVLKPSSWWLCC